MQSPVPLSTTSDRATAERLVVVITLLLIFLMAARTPLDTDLWWHLRAREETLRSGQPLLTDVFSFTRAGAQWINHSWLSQVGMALLFRWGGYLALGAAMALLATLSMGLVLAQCEGPAFLKAGALLLGGVVASVVWVPRPQITTLVMLALVAWLVFRYRRKGKIRYGRYRWCLCCGRTCTAAIFWGCCCWRRCWAAKCSTIYCGRHPSAACPGEIWRGWPDGVCCASSRC